MATAIDLVQTMDKGRPEKPDNFVPFEPPGEGLRGHSVLGNSADVGRSFIEAEGHAAMNTM
jgi:hypothetical protein